MVKTRGGSGRGWCKQKVRYLNRWKYKIIGHLKDNYSMKSLYKNYVHQSF